MKLILYVFKYFILNALYVIIKSLLFIGQTLAQVKRTKYFEDIYFHPNLIKPSDQFRKITIRYKRIGYNMNAMRQTACLLVNPVTVDNFADIFKCTPVGRASDLMMAPSKLSVKLAGA